MDFLGFQSISIGWRDILDISIITLLLYRIIMMVRQTRAVAAIYGLVFLIIAYIASMAIDLNTLSWLLDYVLNSLFLLIVIVFQRDIRQALSTIGTRRLWLTSFFRKKEPDPKVGIVCEAAQYMAQRKIGALIVMERGMPLGDTTERGVTIDAALSPEMLTTLFWPNSPLHDGAVIISRGRILAAGCILPLSTAAAKRAYGTRHRAALGITEESDAVVVIVSEERGTVAISMGGKITGALDEEKLPRVLAAALEKGI